MTSKPAFTRKAAVDHRERGETPKPWISLVGCPFRAENRVRLLPADADCCLIAEVVSKPGAGGRFTGRSVSLRARGLDFSSCAHGPCGQRPPDHGRRP